jgi:hippurate hydrolase
MIVDDRITSLQSDMIGWRHDLHARPETAFEENATSAYVANVLTSLGIPYASGLAQTGLVATIQGREEGRTIALRAELDALDIHEQTNLPYASKIAGKMHACGHDGHMSMLLGAAKELARSRNFSGTVHLIFQPAEEMQGGGKVMIDEGLFSRFPVDEVYGLHNWPGQPVGTFAVKAGPMQASSDLFKLTVTGNGGHAAMPHQSIDPIVTAVHLVSALQSIVSRSLDPLDAGVISVTQIHAGDAWNIIPEKVELRGTVRTFKESVRDMIEQRVRQVAKGIAAAHGAECEVWYDRRYPPMVNTEKQVAKAQIAAAATVGESNVINNPESSMASEDFAYMLQEKPGAYVWMGNGSTAGLHNPGYDFNDEALPVGAAYWINLVERILPISRTNS